MDNTTPRIKGHAYQPTKAGKFDNTHKPRCKCGWVGYAGNASQAKSQYRAHLEAVQSAATNAKIEYEMSGYSRAALRQIQEGMDQ